MLEVRLNNGLRYLFMYKRQWCVSRYSFSLALWRRYYRQFKYVHGLQTSTLDSGGRGKTVLFPNHSCNTPNEVQVVEGVLQSLKLSFSGPGVEGFPEMQLSQTVKGLNAAMCRHINDQITFPPTPEVTGNILT